MADVPDYEPMLAAYHRAYAAELRSMIAALPIEPGMTVLDMACGDGAYSLWLAERVGPSGQVVAVDLKPSYIEIARKAASESEYGSRIRYTEATIDNLPFDPGTFDLVWCAQSLYSLPEPVEALRQMTRVTRAGGIVAVLESDTLHHVLLPWPIEVELAVRVAELKRLAATTEHPRKFYVGRKLREVFRKAGLESIALKTFAIDRAAPLSDDERIFLAETLRRLAKGVANSFEGPHREAFDRLVDPESADYLLDDSDLTVTCINHLVWGNKPI